MRVVGRDVCERRTVQHDLGAEFDHVARLIVGEPHRVAQIRGHVVALVVVAFDLERTNPAGEHCRPAEALKDVALDQHADPTVGNDPDPGVGLWVGGRESAAQVPQVPPGGEGMTTGWTRAGKA